MKRIICVLLVVLVLFASGCSNINDNIIPSATDATAESLPIQDTTEYEADNICCLSGRVLVRSDTADENEISFITPLYNKLCSLTDTKVEYATDWDIKLSTYDRDRYEILVGRTNRPESSETLERIAYDEFIITVIGNKLAVNSYSSRGLKAAVDRLMFMLGNAKPNGSGELSLELPSTGAVVGKVYGLSIKCDIPRFPSDAACYVNTSANTSLCITAKNTDSTDYDEYSRKLLNSGFYESAENKIGENSYSEFVSPDKSMRLFLSYDKSKNSCRVVCEPYSEYEKALGSAGSDDVVICAGNACDRIYYIKMSDGSIVVIDGDCADDAQINSFYSELSSVCGGSDKIRITAWIITHPHPDHINMFLKASEVYPDNLRIDNVIYNFPSDYEMIVAADDASRYTLAVKNAAAKFASKPKVITPHTGQIFSICGTDFEFYYTQEDIYPSVMPNLNATSCVFMMKVATAEGERRVLWTGDMDDNASYLIAKSFGDELKAYAVQIGHHGWNGGGSLSFYRLCAPTIMLWTNKYETWKEQLDKGVLKYSNDIYTQSGVTRHLWCQASPADTLVFKLK